MPSYGACYLSPAKISVAVEFCDKNIVAAGGRQVGRAKISRARKIAGYVGIVRSINGN